MRTHKPTGFARKLLLLIVAIAGVTAAQSASTDHAPQTSVQGVPPGLIATPIKPTHAHATPPQKGIPEIAKAANGAIVSIVMADKGGKPIAQGSGFLVSKDGEIVTNYHVISEGSSAIVKSPNGAFYAVDGVLGLDKARDIAVIKAHGQNFQTLTLGNSDRVQVGEEVVAIGNPLSFESTVSNGIVSAIRTIEEEGGKFLQVTAPISPGSSGGPLFNMAGDVVGITTLKFKGGENLNFAIPINDAKRLLGHRSASLLPLPNEVEATETQKHDGDTPPTGASVSETDSPAHRFYLELLKNGDPNITHSLYACFDDDPQHGGIFTSITVDVVDKESMTVITSRFVNGVSDGPDGIFSGSVKLFAGGLFGTLHTLFNTKGMPSHETDYFEWRPDVLLRETGFGKTIPGQIRISTEFSMQRSTGRYTEQITFAAPDEAPSTDNRTGRCIRIPNTQTPEQTYQQLK